MPKRSHGLTGEWGTDMLNRTSTKKWLGAVALVAITGVAALPVRAELTAAQVLERCEKAYGSLKSYKGTSRVETKGDISGMKMTFNTSAKIQFVSPGKIRVEGTMMTPMMPGRFAFVSDGTHTWETEVSDASKWKAAQSPMMAIAGFTGVSQNAATTIPTALLNLMGGVRYGMLTVAKVSRAAVNGRATYRVDANGVMGGIALWIDERTFLLVKKSVHNDMSKFKMPQGVKLPPNMPNVPTSGVTDLTETFSDVRVNEAVPASTFARPAGVPK